MFLYLDCENMLWIRYFCLVSPTSHNILFVHVDSDVEEENGGDRAEDGEDGEQMFGNIT